MSTPRNLAQPPDMLQEWWHRQEHRERQSGALEAAKRQKFKRPEAGSFKDFWREYRIQYSTTYKDDPVAQLDKALTLLHMFMPYGSSDNIDKQVDRLRTLAFKLYALSSSQHGSDRELATTIYDILDIRCSVRLHPFWFPDENGNWHKDKWEIERKTTVILNWFNDACPERKVQEVPNWINYVMRSCLKMFRKAAGRDWRTASRTSFDRWTMYMVMERDHPNSLRHVLDK